MELRELWGKNCFYASNLKVQRTSERRTKLSKPGTLASLSSLQKFPKLRLEIGSGMSTTRLVSHQDRTLSQLFWAKKVFKPNLGKVFASWVTAFPAASPVRLRFP